MCVCWRNMISSSIDPCDQLSELLSYPIFDLSVSYPQINSKPTMFIMLSYSWLIPRAYTVISLGLTNAITCSHCHGIPSIWKPGWIVVEPISNIVIFSMIYVEHPVSIGNFHKHYLHDPFVKHMYGRKKWLPLIHVHLMQVAAVNSRKLVLLPLESSQVSHAYVWSTLWFDRLAASILYVFLAHQATHWIIQGE